MLVQLDPTTPLPWLIAAYVVFGIGFGFVNAPITNAAVSGMPVAQAGVAAAIATTSRQFGQAIGVAVIGAIIASDAGPTTGTAMTDASHAAWWTLAGLGALVFALGAIATGTRAQRSGRIAAARLSPETIAA
jgi:MFS family permease